MPFDKDALIDEFAQRVRAGEFDEEEKEGSEGTNSAPSQAENSTIKAIRAEAKRAEKRAAEAEAKAAELQAFKEETLKSTREAVLTAEGLAPRQQEAFLKMFDEVTNENVQVFKSEVLGVREEAEEGGVPAVPFAPAGFSTEKPIPPAIAGSAKVKEFVDQHGLDAAVKAWEDGKLKL